MDIDHVEFVSTVQVLLADGANPFDGLPGSPGHPGDVEFQDVLLSIAFVEGLEELGLVGPVDLIGALG